MENKSENQNDYGRFSNNDNSFVPSPEESSNIYNMLMESPKKFQRNFINKKEEAAIADLEKINSEDYTGSGKNLMQRYFSKIEEGSLRASILAISSIALGPGCLSLSAKFKELGFFFTIMLICLGAGAAYWSLKIMIIASKKMKVDEFGKCATASYGKCMGWFIDGVILFYIFGCLISYQVIINKLIGLFIYDAFIDREEYPTLELFNEKFFNRFEIRLIFMYVVCILVIPMCLLKDISKMRLASIFSLVSLFYAISVIVIQSPTYYSYYKENIYKPEDPSTHINWWDFSAPFDPKTLYFFTGAATVFFSYTCHSGAFPVYKSLKRNVSVRINKVFMRSVILNTFVYLIVGICGFLTQPYTKDDLVIFRKKIPGSNDIAMTIARLLMAVNLILSTPANFNGYRVSFLSLFYNDINIINEKNCINVMITIPTLLLSCFIGVLFGDIGAYISILGGFCSVIQVFLVPVLIYIKSNDYPIYHWKNIISIILVICLSGIGYTAGVISILNIINSPNPNSN